MSQCHDGAQGNERRMRAVHAHDAGWRLAKCL